MAATAAIALAIGFAACGDDEDDETTAASETTTSETTTTEDDAASGGGGGGGGETVAISETEYELDPADPTVAAGEVSFEVTNDGTQPHDLEVEGDGVEEVTDTIDAGASDTLTVDLEAGTYELYCTIDGHKDLGMEGELTVE